MEISDLKHLADDETINEPIKLDVLKLVEKQGAKGPFYVGKAQDPTGQVSITFFGKRGYGFGGKSVEVYPNDKGRGITKGSWTNSKTGVKTIQLTVWPDANVDIIQGSASSASSQEELPSNMSEVEGQKHDGVQFHTRMRTLSLMYLHCLDYTREIESKIGVNFTEDQFRNCVTSLWMTSKEEGLTAFCKVPRLPEYKAKKAAAREAQEAQPDPDPDPGPSEAEKRAAAAAKNKAELDSISDMDEEDVPF